MDRDSEDSGDESPMVSEEEEEDNVFLTRGFKHGMIVETAFDIYFTQSAAPGRTSSNVFSHLVPALSAEEYHEAMSTVPEHPFKSRILSNPHAVFRQIMLELSAGFNVLCYGYGSKRDLLNKLAKRHCSKAGYTVVANGFQPDFTLKELLKSIETLPGVTDSQLGSSSPESQTRRIDDFFNKSSARHLYIIIHNIDALPLRAAKAKACLSQLAMNPHIHIIASVDHINSPLLWTTSEITARKSDADRSSSIRGYSWLWHDLTTLAPYDRELAYADKTSINGVQGRKQRDAAGAGVGMLSEAAAMHVLVSVTQKARKLFKMMATAQVEAMEAVGAAAASDMEQFAVSYATLFNMARDNFLATNDVSFRSLLGEYRDHSLVETVQSASGEGLYIPLRKERLENVLGSLQDT
ncbi:origin recognition complex, subunit 2 [Mycena floridula]|nr:origin recognition complex, subunit 2 [Mycena floridula]